MASIFRAAHHHRPPPDTASGHAGDRAPPTADAEVRAHVGRAFVEHVAETQSFGAWRSNSVALADFAEHGSGARRGSKGGGPILERNGRGEEGGSVGI